VRDAPRYGKGVTQSVDLAGSRAIQNNDGGSVLHLKRIAASGKCHQRKNNSKTIADGVRDFGSVGHRQSIGLVKAGFFVSRYRRSRS
jgi:hypothetical protein